MQFLPPLTRDPKVAAREMPAGAHLPYARHIDAHTIETRDGLLMQTVRLGGLRDRVRYADADFEGVDQDIQAMFYGDDAAPR